MKEIPLSKGDKTNKSKYAGLYSAIVDDEDYEELIRYNWSYSYRKQGGYAMRMIKSEGGYQVIYMHRQIMQKIGESISIDHINHNTLDNRKCNLRTCNKSQNMRNIKPRGSSKYLGVYWNKSENRWYANIRNENSKKVFLGSFKVEEDAARAYDEAAKKYHKEFANLNFKVI